MSRKDRPRSVAIIMDGNGRWAVRRGLPRIAGHKRGVDRVQEIISASPDLGVKTLTLYAFSTENWSRPITEVAGLMRLFRIYFRREASNLKAEGVRVRFIGRRDELPEDIQHMTRQLEEDTAQNTRLTLQVALNYGGRDELTRAVKQIAIDIAAGTLDPEDITEALIARQLDTSGAEDPDLVIRTSGEYRTSNFLPWQTSYSEFVFTDECWPDFTPDLYAEILTRFGARDRRFGAIAS
ncbi:MAG: isoprenyl transferase [Pseudomonadota bacterium]